MNNVIIEKLRFEDLERYKNLIDDCFGNSMNIENYRQKYSENKNYEIIVAKINDEIVGSITIQKIDLFTFDFQPMLELFNVCVDTKYRKMKIGTLLMEYVIKFAEENKYKSITLTCLDDLPIIHSFYEKTGFTKANSRKYVMYLSD